MRVDKINLHILRYSYLSHAMRKLFSVLKYTRNYKGYTALNIFFNVLFAIFSAISLGLIAPFLDLLFKTSFFDLLTIANQGWPDFELSSSYFNQISKVSLAILVTTYGKPGALFFICLTVFSLVFLKNIARYMAM